MVVPPVLRVSQTIRATATPAAKPAIPRGIQGSADRRFMSAAAPLGGADNCLRLVEARWSAKLIVIAMFLVTVTGTEVRQKLAPQGT